jgi:hypothetical protein
MTPERFGRLIGGEGTLNARNARKRTGNARVRLCGRIVLPVTPRNGLKDAFAARIVRDGQVWIDMLYHRSLRSPTYDASAFDPAVLDQPRTSPPAGLHSPLACWTSPTPLRQGDVATTLLPGAS